MSATANGAADGTVSYARLHKRGLTLKQQSAVDLLASGKTDRETAELLKLSRPCITRWRLHDVIFQAALNQRRAEVWGSGVERLRSLVPKALDALAEELANRGSSTRLKAAIEVLRLVPLPAGALGIGPIDPEEIVRQIVSGRRAQAALKPLANLLDDPPGLPPFDQHVADVWKELEARAAEQDEVASRKTA
jgi:hypothetical protein